ncbi:hypothetical protein FFA01_22210 [Frigoribacterium faeni]|uniref:Uncharacterized protein n=1 Tax=Frigoribacterium faeni TaxID=145483 RepID=A0ABQ0UR19_9MICO|nr:hypothetical protein GCM10025699_46590 [Microbacterium flavescens]GEK83912.1 hypothetical protein FFA01_22210 [Frigoribacterium faeni]
MREATADTGSDSDGADEDPFMLSWAVPVGTGAGRSAPPRPGRAPLLDSGLPALARKPRSKGRP